FLRGRRPGGGRGRPGGPLRPRRRGNEAVAGAGSGALDAGTAGKPRDLHPRGGDRAAWGNAAPGERLQGGAGETHRRARAHALGRSAVMSDEIGKPYPRRDGRAKVTGEAVYSYEWPVPGILYGVLVRVSAQPCPFTVRMADELHAAFPHDIRNAAGSQPADQLRGDVETALRQAEHKVEAVYETPPETHNPLEPHATLAVWNGDR